MAGLLDGKVGLVTGAGSGIGRATSLEMARNGAKVTVADVNEEGGCETVDTIGGMVRAIARESQGRGHQ